MGTPTLSSNIEFLKKRFIQDIHVFNREKGYLSVPSFNLRMDPKVLKAAALAIAENFQDDDFNSIHGIPHSGNFLAAAVSMEIKKDVRLHTSRKDQVIPTTWKEVYRKEVRSFTTSNDGSDVFAGINLSFVHKGDKILLIDDVCARGETGYGLIKGLQESGIKVIGYAVLFDKVFQGGMERISKLGVKTFSCVRVNRILQGDTVELL